jgi:PAS domain S-box-containing protein
VAGTNSKNKSSKDSTSIVNQAVSNLSAFFNTIDHMLGVVDLDGIFIEVNKAGLNRLGYKMEDLKGKDANIIFPEELHDEITNKFISVREKGRGSWSYSLVTVSGEMIPVELSFHKGVWDKEETYFIVAKELSQEMMVSEARKVSLRILNAETKGKPESIARMALEETVRLTHSKIGFFGSYQKDESLLKDIIWISGDKQFETDKYPVEIDLSKDKELLNKINKKKALLIENPHSDPAPRISSAINNGLIVPLSDGGELKYIVGLGNKSGVYGNLDKNIISILWDNVTSRIKRIYTKLELIENEYAYRNLFDSSRDALLLYDLQNGKIVLCNDQTMRMFGYKSQSEILKKSPMDLSSEFQPDGTLSMDALRRNPLQALTDKVYIPMWTHIKKDGTEFPCEVNLTAIKYKGQQIILANVRDISEKVKVESELKKSEEGINLAIKEAELAIWDYDINGRVMTVGRGFERIMGEKIGQNSIPIENWFEKIHPDDRALASSCFRSHITGESSDYRCEYRIVNKDGSNKWILASGRATHRDENGIAHRVVGILMDITNTKILSGQVEDTRNFLQTIISSIESILFVKDDKGKYLLINRAFSEKFGLSEKEVLGKTSNDVTVKLDIDTTLSDEIVIKQGNEQTYEKEIQLRDGKIYDYLVTKIPIRDKDGEVYSQVGLATDITHIKKLEKDLRNNVFSLDAAVNGTGNGLWDWNLKTDELIVNDNWFQMLGYTRSFFNKKYKKFGFKTFAGFVHPEDVEKVGKELEKHYAGETEYYRIDIRMRTSENQWKWILASGKVWEWDSDNKPVRMVGIHIDIDYRVRIEEQLKQALIKAEESDRLKSAFLANMSHEIRTPMNGIIGFLDLLEGETVSPEQRNEYMNIIRSSSIQLLNIVNDIVDISKIESGQITIRETAFDLDQLLDEIRIQYQPALEEKHLYFNLECSITDDEKKLKTDYTKLRQVFSNLVSNSIKFTNEGGVKLSCKRTGDFIEFCVADTGMGIAGNIQKKVFERFIQADMGLTRIQEGTGLGLSICKAYVEKLGGKIWLESNTGSGSKFFFTIPGCSVVEEINEISEANKLPDDSDERVILVVEDEIYNFLFVEQVLQNRGIRVLHAENGLVAIELVEKTPNIGMILMDIRMPGIDGYEATRRIKEINPDLPVIALTALALSGDREKAMEAGCDDYLKKPVLSDELLMIVDKNYKKN